MTGALSPIHWAIVVVVVLLVFGAKRLPDAARGLGQSMRIFKAETAQLNNDHTEHTAGHAGEDAGEDAPRAVAPGVAPDVAGAPTSAPAASSASSASAPSRAAEPAG